MMSFKEILAYLAAGAGVVLLFLGVIAIFVAVCSIPSALFAWALSWAFGWPFLKVFVVAFAAALFFGFRVRFKKNG